MERSIPDAAWHDLAQALAVEEAALRAVAQVESSGSGFLPPPSELPKILFEGHAFHRLTQGRFDADHPTLSYPKWTKKYYSGGTGEWERLNAACALDRAAALQAASWGAFQIMGFNYALCGFADVEAFVARQKSGAAEQLESFAHFISRQVFLTALRARDWAKFASFYNGAGYAANKYDQKMAAAYLSFSKGVATAAAGRKAKPKKTKSEKVSGAMGRPEFTALPMQRQRVRRRPVKPDRVDLRDWYYRPNITKAPPASMMPHNPRAIADQGDTSACTGFALATAVEYLLDRASRPVERISGHMLYSMARRYDEWTDNDNADEGSSLRGALKGWSRHGASALKFWRDFKMPRPKNNEDDWWLDSVRRPLGAYFRMALDVESDLHSALMDVGVLYASAFTHSGWDALLRDDPLDSPVSVDTIPVIECRKGDPDGGHAFAIVGYTDKGFIVHNSWGPQWGQGGFGVLTYSDWRQNAMDCWVAQLGVVTLEHQRVAQASSLRLEGEEANQTPKRISGAPAVLLSSSPELANHEISPFVIDMQNEGRLSDSGRFRTNDDDLASLLEHHLAEASIRWGIGKGEAIDVAIYAHGGLVSEDAAASSARQWIPLLYSNRIFPIYLMWETDGLSTVFNIVEDAIKGDDERISANWIERFRERVIDWKNERIEGLTRKPGGSLWRQMKDNANDISATRQSGVVKLFHEYDRLAKNAALPKLRLHLIGHSAGAIVHTYLAPRAIEHGFEVASINLLAPAVRVDDFHSSLGNELGASDIRLFVAHLIDSAESADPTCKPYGHSLLYLVSRAFEKGSDVALLGMEKYLSAALATHAWGAQVTRLGSPGVALRPGAPLTAAASHGGLDDDVAVQDAVIQHIKGPAWNGRVVRARGS